MLEVSVLCPLSIPLLITHTLSALLASPRPAARPSLRGISNAHTHTTHHTTGRLRTTHD